MIAATPFVYGYGRASTDKQAITEFDQKEVSEEYFRSGKKLGRISQEAEWGGWFYDPATSSTVPWFERPFGEALFNRLRRGDMIIVSRFDRAVRSIGDCDSSLRRLDEAGVGLVMVDFNIDTTTSTGQMLMNIITCVNQFLRTRIGEQTSAALQWKMRHKLPKGGPPPIGHRQVGRGADSRFQPSAKERRIAYLIVELKDDQGVSFEDICCELRKQGVKGRTGKELSFGTVWNYYAAAKADFPIYPDTNMSALGETSAVEED